MKCFYHPEQDAVGACKSCGGEIEKMAKTDKVISLALLGPLAPVALMLSFWWGSIPFCKGSESTVGFLAISGFALGLALDAIVLRKFLFKLFDLSMPTLAALGFFYTVMMFGFFMGMPAFNCMVGIVGSYIVVRGGIVKKNGREETVRKNISAEALSFLYLLVCCVSTTVLALNEPSINSQMQHMLHLPFEVTQGMIWALILVGGGLLLLFQFGCSQWIARKMLNKLNS